MENRRKYQARDCVVAVEGRDCPLKTIDEIGKLQNISDLCVNGVHLYSSIFHLSEKHNRFVSLTVFCRRGLCGICVLTLVNARN